MPGNFVSGLSPEKTCRYKDKELALDGLMLPKEMGMGDLFS
jgi:hypothetical protein